MGVLDSPFIDGLQKKSMGLMRVEGIPSRPEKKEKVDSRST
jgi:hypothetical protein